jgi:ABC-type multidrug transport system ATPase subunit/ABC-type multidrug transport system permease subunit
VAEATSTSTEGSGEELRGAGVGVTLPDGRRILQPASLLIAPGSFTALLGASGSGKTTLLKVLAGVMDATEGTASLGDAPAAARVADLGYVPQRETVHERLTVREALRYAALLRLDPDDGPPVDDVVEDVLHELDLTAVAETQIRLVSGGERRRAACGLELVGRPRVLLLDEPTSGLDPVLERRLMAMFRRLADQGTAVVVVTHATASLDLCDTVAVLQDGALAISGSPADAVEFLGAVARDAAGRDGAEAAEFSGTGAARRGAIVRPLALELRVLIGRYVRTLVRDRRTLAVLLGQAPIIGLLIGVLFEPHALRRPDGQPGDAIQLVFLVMTGSIWLGITAACREVVKERGILEREFDVGLRLDAYILAKAAVLGVLSAMQVLLMVAVVLVLQPLDVPATSVLTFAGLAVLVAWVSVALGLAVSAAARSVDQAAGAVPVLLIPQLLFAGALVPVDRMPRLIAALADLTFARWAYAAMGSSIDLGDRLTGASGAAQVLGFGGAFFRLRPAAGALALVLFGVLILLLAVVLLYRRATLDA